ncbi:hypothetical protein KFU94_28120 [Chloroflexi bacterium TSY]|nr:hypothetical protein [Chloroflexi bacterium TSY]
MKIDWDEEREKKVARWRYTEDEVRQDVVQSAESRYSKRFKTMNIPDYDGPRACHLRELAPTLDVGTTVMRLERGA